MTQHLHRATAALERARVANSRLTAEVLLARACGRERSYLYAHPEAELSAAEQARFEAWIARRAAGEPLQHLTGEQEFYGRVFQVSPAVLIPRPETELVLEAALERIPADAPWRIADVGTGSGCLAVSLALERTRARVLGVDRSLEALEIARANAQRLNADVEFAAGDLLEAVAGDFNLIVSNPPYISETDFAALAPEVRDHEPQLALLAGPTGNEVYARLIPQAAARLRPGGWLVLELGYNSAAAVQALLAAEGGWDEIETRRDLQGWERALLTRRLPVPTRKQLCCYVDESTTEPLKKREAP